MASRRVVRNRRFVTATLVGAVVGVFLGASVALAITVRSSAVHHLGSADIQLDIASTDSTGTVLLFVDRAVVGARDVTPGMSVDFGNLEPDPGSHVVFAVLRSRGGAVASAPLPLRVWDEPEAASLVEPVGATRRFTRCTVRVGAETSGIWVYVNGRLAKNAVVRPDSTQCLGTIELDPGLNRILLVAANPVARTHSTVMVRRVDAPWATCIVIDKSDRRLYWFRNNVLVESYPIAIGKASTPTPSAIWRVGAKYFTDPSSVYGPRKMRLFRKVGSSFVYTRYAIHGTNQPWVIGTQASHGCIRMYNSDVLELFPQVPVGTMVQTRE